MEAFKTIFTSKVIIANIVTTVATLATVWGLNLTPEQQATAVTVIVTLGTLVFSNIFRVTATTQLVSSAEVAKEANKQMRPGVPSETALSVAKATVAARDNNRPLR